MIENHRTPFGISEVDVHNICGLWEVIRIQQKNGQPASYPWIKDRFKFNFLSEMIFLRLKDGLSSHGIWELVKRAGDPSDRYAIRLDGKTEFRIRSISEEDMILSDGENDLVLIRRV